MNNIEIIYGNKSLKTDKQILISESDFIPLLGKEVFSEPIKYLNNIQKLTVKNTPFLQLFNYDNLSLWWFLHPTIFPEIQKLISFIIKFQEFIDKIKPDTIRIIENFHMFDIINQICKKNNITLIFSKNDLLKFKTFNKVILAGQKFRYKKITNKKINTRENLFFKKYDSLPNLDDKIIFAIPTLYRRSILDLSTGQSKNGEYIQQSIMDLIDKKDDIIGILL